MEMTHEVNQNEPVETKLCFKWLVENTAKGAGSPVALLSASLNC